MYTSKMFWEKFIMPLVLERSAARTVWIIAGSLTKWQNVSSFIVLRSDKHCLLEVALCHAMVSCAAYLTCQVGG